MAQATQSGGQRLRVRVSARAEELLSEDQQRLVVAMVTKNQAASADPRAQMSGDDAAAAANFMMETPQTCAAQ